MARTKVLICVKTYPTLSEKYNELVCTAGICEDGKWIRIYPVPFRELDYAKQYKKWQWIELDLEKNTRDLRPESYRPNLDHPITILDYVGTEHKWQRRKDLVLKKVWTNMSELIAEAKDPSLRTSLAILKPQCIKDFIWEPCEREWDKKKLLSIKLNTSQLSIFDCISDKEDAKRIFNIVKKIPYKFSYIFETEDGITRTLMIEDWELGMLYLNALQASKGNEEQACQKVREKYFTEFTQNKDLYFFLGTTLKFHNIAPNPFIIIGTFYPPKNTDNYPTLF